MNEPRPEVEILEPTTARTGGRAARVAAVVTIAVLVAFVYVGVTGRAPAPAPLPESTPPLIAAATEPPTPMPLPSPTAAVDREPPVQQFPDDRSAQRPGEFVAAVLSLGEESYVADLEEVGPNHYVGAYRIARPMPAEEVTLELAEITTANDMRITLGRWHFPLDPLLGYLSTAGNWLEDVEPPKLQLLESPTLAQTGYRIEITTDSRAGFAVLSVDVRGGPNERSFADEQYMVRATFDGRTLQAPLEELATGNLRASLPLPETDGAIAIEVTRVFSPYPLFGYDHVSTLEMTADDVDYVLAVHEPTAFFIEMTAGKDLSRHYPRLLRTGYTLTYWVVPRDQGGRLVVTAVASE